MIKNYLKRSRFIRSLWKAAESDLYIFRFEITRICKSFHRIKKIQRYLDSHKDRKLHLGAGSNIFDGWLNTDILPKSPEITCLDITEPLLFSDRIFNYIYSEHLIEHIPFERAIAHFQECYRILVPGGKIRIATPNLEFLINLCLNAQKTDSQRKYLEWTVDNFFPQAGIYNGAFVINNFLRNWEHQFIYNFAILENIMKQAGFTNIKSWPVGKSDDSELQNLEKHGEIIGEDINLLQTMCLEAVKI